MKPQPKVVSSLLALLICGCAKNLSNADDCSISVNSVTFTKSINNAKDLVRSTDSNVIAMESGPNTDFFNAPDGEEKFANAPILLIPIDNGEPFTFTTQVTPEFSATYDAGAVYVFVNNDVWQKFAFEMDERKKTRIVTVRTNQTSDDNNHDAVDERSVFLKISSNVESIGYYYSTDNINWQLVRVYKNDFPKRIWLGISSQSPIGKGITSQFENCTLTDIAIADFRKGI